MIVTCENGHVYDDTYHRTSCPHPAFEMHSLTTAGTVTRCCHSIEEQDAFIANPQPAEVPCPVQVAREAVLRGM